MTNTQTSITCYASHVRFESFTRVSSDFAVIEELRDIRIGYVSRMTGGFLHFSGERGTCAEGVTAIIRPRNAEPQKTIAEELAEGIRSGRDDRKF